MVDSPAPPSPVFRLDRSQKDLTSDGAPVPVAPKAVDLLLFLVAHAGRVVTRAELVEGVWGGLSVSSDAVRHAMRALRRALGDPATEPRFIETVARRGWRFIGQLVPVSGDCWLLEARTTPSAAGDATFRTRTPFVGRDGEMRALLDPLSRAHAGERQSVFVRGEPGIGKSRLLDAFLAEAAQRPEVVFARSECIEHVGPGMPYAPLFDILEQICSGLGGALPTAMLRRHAPTWLSQMPSLTAPEERVSLEEAIQGASQTRMIREWAQVLERFAEGRTLVVAVEDLQWADPSTLAALFFLVRRIGSARLFFVGTLRGEGRSRDGFDLAATLAECEARGCARSFAPAALDAEAARRYLEARFGADQEPARSESLVTGLVAASSGNPLFLVSLVDECERGGLLCEVEGAWRVEAPFQLRSVPATLRPLIERQLGHLEADLRETLEAASVVGMDFSAAALAAATSRDVDEVESVCDQLVADGRFVVARDAVAWPDGTVGSSYRFTHGLHREVLRDGLSPGRRSRLHRAVGERLRDAYAGAEQEVAPELAMHFEAALDVSGAVAFHVLAGETSARRFSNLEAVEHFRRALALIERDAFDGRDFAEIRARLGLCAPLAVVAGYGAADLEANLGRLEVLTKDIEDSPEMFPVLLGLWSLNLVRGDLDRTGGVGARLLALAERNATGIVTLQAHRCAGHCDFFRGDVVGAEAHFTRATTDYPFAAHERQDYSIGDDPLVLVLSYRAWSRWFLGRVDAACESADEAVRVGKRLEHPPSLAFALTYGAVLHQLRGDVARAWEWSDRSLDLATAEGMPLWLALSRIVRGWSLAQAEPRSAVEGVALIRQGLADWEDTGSNLGRPHFLCLLASSLGRIHDHEGAFDALTLADKCIEETGQRVFASEIARTRGDLHRASAEANAAGSDRLAARAGYARAVAEARAAGLRTNELQAVTRCAELEPDDAAARDALAALLRSYPAASRMDLDLARARRLLGGD